MNAALSRTQAIDPRWKALQTRDPSVEGAFVYAVSTTGVYCRPTCMARLPRPENVRFFASGEAAARAGFRPCKRCKPDLAPLGTRHANAIAKACALIEAAEETPDFNEIAGAISMSRHHFQRVFKEVAGMTPGAYHKALRERRAINGLGDAATVTEAIYGAGYGSSSRFYETVAPKLGLKPSAFLKGGAGEVIRFAVGECSLGSVLVAATEKGLCAVEFGDAPEPLVQGLETRFPKAELVGGDPAFEFVVAQAIGFIEAPAQGCKLPLDVRGTAFQQQIWQLLREIPPGKTMSYAELAARVGLPRAVRAVARACASNRIAVAIPCHRIVRSDGSLSGYRWGVERKAALLAKERSK